MRILPLDTAEGNQLKCMWVGSLIIWN